MSRRADERVPGQPELARKGSAPAEQEPAEKQSSEDSPLEGMASGMGNQDFSKMLGAEAYAGGQDTAFGAQEQDGGGQEMLPHEAAHTVQQGR